MKRTTTQRFTVTNSNATPLEVCLEPEGDVIRLATGERMTLALVFDNVEPDLEIEADGNMLLFYASATKHVWQGTVRRR